MTRLTRAGVAGVLLVGMLWAGGVVQAKPEPVRGGPCVRVGAIRVAAGATLRCFRTVEGTKVWRAVAAGTTTTSTSTTSTSTTSTSTTAVIVPSVTLAATSIQDDTFPKAVTVTANVAGTIYLVEGDFVIKTLSDITSAPSYRWAKGTVTSANTPTFIPIDVGAVTNGYYRVFVANSQGVLSLPATNIVTVSVTRASTASTSTTSTTVALTCATGGSCTVGVSTGAGGGIVFYYSATAFTSIGSTCNTNCHYLEVAPTTGSSAWIDLVRSWATGSNRTSAVSGADGTAIGTGYQNTSDIIAQTGNVAATSAAAEARAYRGPNNRTDWFLPSKGELDELYVNRLAIGSFSGALYWSSSENRASASWGQSFFNGAPYDDFKSNNGYVRPVRAG